MHSTYVRTCTEKPARRRSVKRQDLNIRVLVCKKPTTKQGLLTTRGAVAVLVLVFRALFGVRVPLRAFVQVLDADEVGGTSTQGHFALLGPSFADGHLACCPHTKNEWALDIVRRQTNPFGVEINDLIVDQHTCT